MKIYLAEVTPARFIQNIKMKYPVVHLLGSYYYFKKIDMDWMLGSITSPVDFFADSGAFTAYHQNETINISEYADWLHQWKHLFHVYANLDVKGGHVEPNIHNLKYLEGRGLNPLPVFHIGEPFEVLRDYCADYDYVAIGMAHSGTMTDKTLQMRVLNKIFEIADGTKIHGFAMVKKRWLETFPFYSVDSSTWSSAYTFGTIKLWDKRKNNFVIAQYGNTESIRKAIYLLQKYPVNIDRLADGTAHWSEYGFMALDAYTQYQDYINRIWSIRDEQTD